MISGSPIFCFGTVAFFLWVLVNLVKEWIGSVGPRAQVQKVMSYPIRKKHKVVVPIDSRREPRGVGARGVVEGTPGLYDLENRRSATGAKF